MVHLAVFRPPKSSGQTPSVRSCPSSFGTSNKTHITRVYEEDRRGAAAEDPLSLQYWRRSEERNRNREKLSVFDRLSRPKTSPADLAKRRADVARSSLSLTDRSRTFHRSLSAYHGKRGSTHSEIGQNAWINGSGGHSIQPGVVVTRPESARTKPRRPSSTNDRTRLNPSHSNPTYNTRSQLKRAKGRCQSAPVVTTSTLQRPCSPYHVRCLEDIQFYCQVPEARVHIASGEEAQSLIRERVRRSREVLVAVLDSRRVVPELVQRRLFTEEEVLKVLDLPTKQDQNRKVLSILVAKPPSVAHAILQVIREQQEIFRDLLEVNGLDDFISRLELERYGEKACEALKHLANKYPSGLRSCPICLKKARKKRSNSERTCVGKSGGGCGESEQHNLGTNIIPKPTSCPLTEEEKRRVLNNLWTIKEVPLVSRNSEEEETWLRVLRAEPSIIGNIYTDT